MTQTRAAALWTVILGLVAVAAAGARQERSASADTLMGQALHLEEGEGDLEAAIATYKRVASDPAAGRALVARALLRIGHAQEALGQSNARAAYERIIREFADQAAIAGEARSRLAALDDGTSPGPARVVVEQVWAGEDADPFGSVSGDGRLFAYAERASTATNIAVRDLATGDTRRLTHTTDAAGGSGYYPVISPDAKQVAYVWEEDPNGVSIRLATLDGTRSRVLLTKPGFGAYNLRWSPSGQQIAAVLVDYSRDRTGQIVLISTADGTVTELKSLGWSSAEIGGFSPDGRFLICAMGASPSSMDGIFALAVDGSGQERLVHGPARYSSPSWTPDSRRVVFVSDRSGAQDLWSVRVSDGKADGEPELLRANVGEIFAIGFTRDGSYFYGTRNSKSDVYVSEFDPDNLRALGTPARLSDRFIGSNSGASWSPDGRRVAFFRGSDRRTMSLVVRALADGTERTLPTGLADSIHAAGNGGAWMPDGRALLLPDIDFGRDMAMVKKVDVATGAVQVLVQDQGIWPVARVSPDGQMLYYTRVEKQGKPNLAMLHLVARAVSGGPEMDLYRTESPGVGFFGLSVSPDGRQIAFMANEGTEPGKERTLMTVPTGGGSRRVLYRGTHDMPTPRGLAWTRDGRHILAIGIVGSRHPRVLVFPAGGGEPRSLDLTMEGLSAINIAPDGRHLVFTATQNKREVWAIRHLLPSAAPSLAPSRKQ